MASRSRTFATRRGCGRMATAAPAWSRSRASVCSPRRAAAIPPTAWRSRPTAHGPSTSQKMVLELLLSDVPETVLHARFRARSLGEAALGRQAPFRSPASAGPGRLAPGDCGEPRRLHPVRPLRARLPRRTGQRRHRLRLPRPGLEDRVRPRRSDGRFHLRRLRRMRPGVSDRRAHARARGREDRRRQAGGVGLPVLRRRMPAHLPRQGQRDSLRAGQGRSGELEPAVRQGPLRLRLRAAQASPHHGR